MTFFTYTMLYCIYFIISRVVAIITFSLLSGEVLSLDENELGTLLLSPVGEFILILFLMAGSALFPILSIVYLTDKATRVISTKTLEVKNSVSKKRLPPDNKIGALSLKEF